MSGILTGDLYVLDLGEARCSPNVVEELRGEHVLDLAGGFARTMVLSGKGIARSVAPGSSDAPLVEVLGGGLEEQLAQVAFGSKHVAALTHDGQLYTLGSGVCGQLGHGNTMDGDAPRMVSVLDGRAIAQVACGRSHSLALTSEGDVYSWGAGESGQLGLGKMAPSFTPRYVSALQSTPIALVTTGAAHVAALSVYGRVYTWGEAMCGQLGLGKPLRNQPLPMEVGLLPLPHPLCFRRHAAALRTRECPLECPLSAPPSACPCLMPPQVPGLPDIKSLASGEAHTAALSVDGGLYAWGLATRGPPLSRKTTPSPEKVEGLPGPMAAVTCGGGTTVVIGEDGATLCWPGVGRELSRVPLPPGVCASRVACSGAAALIFVPTALVSIVPACCPLRGGNNVTLRGSGFYPSDGIVLKFTHASGEQKLVRGKYARTATELLVTAQAPRFVSSAEGRVEVSISFEEGIGDTFTASTLSMTYYREPALGVPMPSCAPAATPSPLVLAATNPSTLFASADALAFVYGPDGAVLGTAKCTYDPHACVMRMMTPKLAKPCPDAYVRLALDGQTPAPDGQPLHMHAPLKVLGTAPTSGPSTGGTKIIVKAEPLFASPHVQLTCTVLHPPPPPPPPPPPAVAEGMEGEEAAGLPPAPPAPPEPLAQLEEGHTFSVKGVYEARSGGYAFVMPSLGATGTLIATPDDA
jgi:hypothetical protein